MNKFKILALFGKSGAGKNTLQNWITAHYSDTHLITPYTSRPQRDNEENGKDYYFISEDDFGKKLTHGEMIEASYFNHWFYGTSINSLEFDDINVGVFNITGIKYLLKDDRVRVCPLLIEAPDSIRLMRNLSREENPDCHEICRRFLADEEDFADIPFSYLSYSNGQEDGTPFIEETWPTIMAILGDNN